MTVQPHIVLDFNIGNTRIRFADNYCANRTEEEIKIILRDIARKAQRSLSAKAVREKDE